MNRGPLKFSIDGSNNIVYSHADQLSTASVSTNQSLVAGNWSHVAVRADFNSSTLSIFLDGQRKRNNHKYWRSIGTGFLYLMDYGW